MPGYTYRGTDLDAKPKFGPRPKPANPDNCGTPKGIWQHRRDKQPNCAKCREAYNADRRRRWHERKE